MRVSTKVTFGLFGHIGGSNRLIEVFVHFGATTQCPPVIGSRIINVAVQLIAGFHVVQQRFRSTEDDTTGCTFVMQGLHIAVVVLAFLDGITGHHTGFVIALHYPRKVSQIGGSIRIVVVNVTVFLGELLDTGVAVLQRGSYTLFLPFGVIA